MSSCIRNDAHSGGTPNLVQAICRAGLLMLSKARRMSQEETRQAECVSLACSRASTSRSEALSVWVEHVVGFPSPANSVRENAGSELAEDFE